MKFSLKTFLMMFIAGIIVSLSGTVFATPEKIKGPKIVNVMPAFWEFEDKTRKTMSSLRHDELFRNLVIEPYHKIYSISEFKRDITDQDIESFLKWVKPYLPRMRHLTNQIDAKIQPALERFLDTFPNFNANNITVVFMPSLKEFGGMSRPLKNREKYILFGLDVIAAVHGKNFNLPVLFTHEFSMPIIDKSTPLFSIAIDCTRNSGLKALPLMQASN